MKPTKQEWDRAKDLGAQARRSGRKADENPHRNDSTERGALLAEAWDQGYDSERAAA